MCVPASPAAFTQLGNPDVCLPAGSVSPQPCGLFLGSSGFGRLPESLAKYRQQLSGYSAVRLPRRPGHLASRRRVGARHSVSPSGSLTLRLRKNRAVSVFLRRWKLRVVVPGGCLAIRVFDSSKPASSWAVGFPGSAPIRVPDALPPGGVPSSLPSGSPPVLSLLLAAWYLAVGAPALRNVGSRRSASYPTGCRLAGSAVIRLPVSGSRADSLRSVYRTVCPADVHGGCGGVVGRRTVFLPAVCSSGKVGAGLRIRCPAVELIGWWVLRG